MKGKIFCPAGCQNPVARITKAKEILKNPRPAGSWRPLKCIFSGKGKSRSQRAAKPRSGVILTEEKDSTQRAGSPALFALCTEEPDRSSLRQLQSKYRPVYQISLFAHLSPRSDTCWGCHPKPAFCGPSRRKIPHKYFFGFFKNSSDLHSVFLLSVREQTAVTERS